MIQYKVEKLFPWLFRIHDPLNVYFYLIIGESKAMLFDMGHGVGNITEAVKAIIPACHENPLNASVFQVAHHL